MEQAKYEGEKVFMDGRDWVVPSLGVYDFKQNYSNLVDYEKSINVENAGDKIFEVAPILYLAFKRNYPEITLEKFIDMVDLAAFQKIYQAVLARSGMKKAGAAGETHPVANQTGAGSTAP
ncbi:MAG: hypothetical protein M3P27_02900 [Acidobacteriota bacterium]|nr:hypothetical protein [Acidobacteriota bacterium]